MTDKHRNDRYQHGETTRRERQLDPTWETRLPNCHLFRPRSSYRDGSIHCVSKWVNVYRMPKIWNDTIENHHAAVKAAVLDAAADLIAEFGAGHLTMSAVAARTGIGRATLYKYFPDIETLLTAWHERQVAQHVAQLAEIARRPGTPRELLATALETYVRNAFGRRGGHDLIGLHGTNHVARARGHLLEFFSGLIGRAQEAGQVRADSPAGELAAYAVAALDAASALPTKAATVRLIAVVLDGLAPTKSSRASATRSSAPGARRGS
jgi:AcrR family transcriptional regulator